MKETVSYRFFNPLELGYLEQARECFEKLLSHFLDEQFGKRSFELLNFELKGHFGDARVYLNIPFPNDKREQKSLDRKMSQLINRQVYLGQDYQRVYYLNIVDSHLVKHSNSSSVLTIRLMIFTEVYYNL